MIGDSKKKSTGYIFLICSIVFNVAAAILFGISRENKSTAIVVLLVLAAVIGIASLIKHLPLTEYLSLALVAVAGGLLVVVFLGNMADIFAKNNVIGLSGAFIASLVTVVLSMITSCGAVIAKMEK